MMTTKRGYSYCVASETFKRYAKQKTNLLPTPKTQYNLQISNYEKPIM